MDAKLVVVGGDAKAAEIPLNLPVTIGRGREASLALPHPLVSRKHCKLYEADGYLMVRDLGSLNGTYVNNRRVDEAVLPPGELLTLGTVTFRAIYTLEATQASATDQSHGSSVNRVPLGSSSPRTGSVPLPNAETAPSEAETMPHELEDPGNASAGDQESSPGQ